MASDSYTIAGSKVTVSNYTSRRLIHTSYGIEVMIAPGRRWWCLWLCTRGTRDAESIAIAARIFPENATEGIAVTNSCASCSGLKAGHGYWGWLGLSGPGVARMSYEVDIALGGERRHFTGDFQLT